MPQRGGEIDTEIERASEQEPAAGRIRVFIQIGDGKTPAEDPRKRRGGPQDDRPEGQHGEGAARCSDPEAGDFGGRGHMS